MGDHKDDESELDPDTPIASLTFGETRDFVLKYHHRSSPSDKTKRKSHLVSLGHGDLLLMNNPTNRYWTHCIPRRKNITRARINLTFRKIIENDVRNKKRKSSERSPYFKQENAKKQCT